MEHEHLLELNRYITKGKFFFISFKGEKQCYSLPNHITFSTNKKLRCQKMLHQTSKHVCKLVF